MRANASFERLKLVASKGYTLAFVWPDRSDKDPGVCGNDEIKLSSDVKASIKRFTMSGVSSATP